MRLSSLIKISHNPLILDYDGLYLMRNNKIFDRAYSVKQLIKVIIKRIRGAAL